MEKPWDLKSGEHPQKENTGVIEVRSPQELRALMNDIPDGTVYSIQLEVVLTNE